MTDPVNVVQGDYIAVLEDEAVRERHARRVLDAQLRSARRALGAYVERFGDITSPEADGAGEGVPDAGNDAGAR